MPNCSVSCCKKRSGTSSLQKDGVTFHPFPKHTVIRNLWKRFCNNKRTWDPKRSSVICSNHFHPSDFKVLVNNRRKLVEYALPRLLPDCTCVTHLLPIELCDKGPAARPGVIFTSNMLTSPGQPTQQQIPTTVSVPKCTSNDDITDEIEEQTFLSSFGENVPTNTIQKRTKGKEDGCRLCMRHIGNDTTSYNLTEPWVEPWDGMEETLADDLYRLARIKITNEFSEIICAACYGKLKQACEFVKNVTIVDNYLRNKLESECDTALLKPIEEEKSNNTIEVDVKVEIEEFTEVDDDNSEELSDDGIHDSTLEQSNSDIEIKIEPELIMPQDTPQAAYDGSRKTTQCANYGFVQLTSEIGNQPNLVACVPDIMKDKCLKKTEELDCFAEGICQKTGKTRKRPTNEETLAKDRIRKREKHAEIKSDPEKYRIFQEKEKLKYLRKKEKRKTNELQIPVDSNYEDTSNTSTILES